MNYEDFMFYKQYNKDVDLFRVTMTNITVFC